MLSHACPKKPSPFRRRLFTVAKIKQAPVGRRIPTCGGAQGGDTEAARRGTHPGHSDSVGPADPTGASSDTATDVRSRVLSLELWFSPRTQRTSGGEGRSEVCCRGQAMDH